MIKSHKEVGQEIAQPPRKRPGLDRWQLSDTIQWTPGEAEFLISLSPRRQGLYIAQMTSVKDGGRRSENPLAGCCQFNIEKP